jgi:signal transduction histidine kinase
MVACDPTVLAVVLLNLVGNAIKYIGGGISPERRIWVRSRVLGALLRFEVEDTGPGLPPGSEARAFDLFERLDAASSGKEGVGLGLATVKRIVEAHDGEVGVESRPGRGSSFWFTLRLATGEHQRVATGGSRPQPTL